MEQNDQILDTQEYQSQITHTTTEYHNRKLAVLLPLLLAVVFVAGMFIVWFLKKDGYGQTETNINRGYSSNKISTLLELIDRDYVDTVDLNKLIEVTMPELLQQLDPHSVYIPAEDLLSHNEPLQGNFDGIGVQFNMINDTIYIINTIPNGPSEKVGILAGDRIITINDSTFSGIGAVSEDVIKQLKGTRGTKVKVGIARRDLDQLIDFEIERDAIPLYSVDISYMVNQNTGFIKINSFGRTTHAEFVDGINALKQQGMSKLILDLRGNGGGYLDPAIEIADEFLEAGKLIVYTEGRSRARTDYYATNQQLCKGIELVVLLDEWSASASEILAGAIQDNDRGTIIGRRSFGKGLVQEPTSFTDGSAVRLTIARYYTPTGRCIQKPYNGNDTEDYYSDIAMRYEHGEFSEVDSIHFSDSLKYTTPKGKTVYGGGGIMPDVFIPFDTIGYTDFYTEVSRKGLIYRFALDYTDNHRSELSKFETPKQLVSFLERQNCFDQFIQYTLKKGVKPKNEQVIISKKLINTQLMAFIARNIIDEAGFYPIIEDIDYTLKKAIEYINNQL